MKNPNSPLSRPNFRSLSLVSLFAALMAVLGLIPRLDLPLGVPITAQTLGVMLAGCLLGGVRGFQAVLLFLFAVVLGLPLLAGGHGGVGVFLAPSVGYLIAWPFGALATGVVMQMLPAGSPRRAALNAFVASFVGGLLVVHAAGVLGLMLVAHLSWSQALLGTLVFVPGDLIKCGIAAMVIQSVARGLPDWQMSRTRA